MSYSHRDRRIAAGLHRAIERYRVPDRLAGLQGLHGPVPARLYPIFRDRDELAAGPLARQLVEAIGQARCFILICSQESARSRWVNEEVTHFLSLGDPSRLLCLIADGTPHAADPARECFPPVLLERGLEPMAADIHADGLDNARLKIIAGLLGVGFDELKRRDLIARNRRLVALASLSLAVAIVTAALAVVATRARQEAERSRQRGEELIGFMLGELRGKLEPLGKLDILDAVGDRAMAYFASLDGERDPGPRARAARAMALRQIGEVRFAQGRHAEAVEALTAALALQRQLVADQPQDSALLFELGQTEFWVGYAAWRAGDFDRAEINLSAYQTLSGQLVERDPGNQAWRGEVVFALHNLGVLAFERRRYAQAHALFSQAITAADALLAEDGIAPATAIALIESMSWAAGNLMKLDRPDAAMAMYGDYIQRLRRLLTAIPDDRRGQAELAGSLSTYCFSAIEAGRPDLALTLAGEGKSLAGSLIDTDAGNLDYRALLAYHRQCEGTARFQTGQWREASAAIAEASAALVQVLEQDPSQMLQRVSLLSAWDLSFSLAWQAGDTTALRQLVRDALAVTGTMTGDAGDAPAIRATAHVMALELALFVDRDDAAAQAHREAARAALDLSDERAADLGRRVPRLKALLAIMRGLDHIPDTALPTSQGPWDYSVIRFIERHCRAAPLASPAPELACESLLRDATTARERGFAAGGSSG